MCLYQSRMMFYLQACDACLDFTINAQHRDNRIAEIMILEALEKAERKGFALAMPKTIEESRTLSACVENTEEREA